MQSKDLYAMSEEFYRHLKIINFSPSTIKARKRHISHFFKWCNERGIKNIDEVSRELVEDYQRHLYYYRKKDGEALKFCTQRERLYEIKFMFHYFAKNRHIPFNPAGEIELPMLEKSLPRAVLNAEEVEKVMEQPDIKTPLGIRARAILETFYSTGMRREELVRITKFDLDIEGGTLFIRQGKGKKDRLIPIGERALKWIKKYMEEVRILHVKKEDPGHIFLTVKGSPMSAGQVSITVRKYVIQAGIEKKGSCHMFRHTMATLMLEGGAEIRYVQQMLGHEAITSTQIYTQISIKKLQEVHKQTHPAKWRSLKEEIKNKENEDEKK